MVRIYSLLVASFLCCQISHAKELAGVKLNEVVTLSVGGKELKLKGGAVRMRAQHAVYVGGLYLEDEKLTSGEEVLSSDSAKRFVFHCTTEEITPNKMVEALEQGFNINHSKADLHALRPHFEAFRRVWQIGINKGDEVWFDFVPGRGTIISINGEQQAEIAGEEFYTAFLKVWLGEHPVNSRMKQALLGKQ